MWLASWAILLLSVVAGNSQSILPTTELPTTELQTTTLPTTELQTTTLPTTELQTTTLPTTQLQTTTLPTTELQTTTLPTTELQTTTLPTTELQTTTLPTTQLPTTQLPTTQLQTTRLQTIQLSTPLQPTTTTTTQYYSSTLPPVQSLGEGNVNCSSDLKIKIIVPSSLIQQENLNIEEPLHVEGNKSCKIDYNGGVFNGEMSLTKCFTQTTDDKNIMYEAKIVGGGNSPAAQNGVIIRKSQFALDVICKYDRIAEIEPAKFVATRGKVSYKDEEMGEFTFTLKLFEDKEMTKAVSAEREIATTDMVYADLRLMDVDNSGLKMGIQDCFASPSDDRSNTVNTYFLIQNRCFLDDTVVSVISSTTEYEFGFLAFQFTGDIKQIYLHCKAAVCKADDKTGACDQPSQKCGGVTKRSLTNATLVSPAQIFGTSLQKRSIIETVTGVPTQDRMVRSIPITSEPITLEEPEQSLSVRQAIGKTSWLVALLCMVALALNITLVVALVVRKIRKRNFNPYHLVPKNDF